MDDNINKTINEMRSSPELLQQYSEQIKNQIPELQDPNNQNNLHNLNNYQQEYSNNLSAEQQLELLQQIKANKNQQIMPSNYEQYEESEVSEDTQSNTTIETTKEDFSNTNYQNIWNKIKIPLLVSLFLFIFLLPDFSLTLNRFIISIIHNNNIFVLNLIKALFGGICFYIITGLCKL